MDACWLLVAEEEVKADKLLCAELEKQGITGPELVSRLLPSAEWNVFCSLGKKRSAGSIVAIRRTSDQVGIIMFSFLHARTLYLPMLCFLIDHCGDSTIINFSPLSLLNSFQPTYTAYNYYSAEQQCHEKFGTNLPADRYDKKCLSEGHYQDGRLIILGDITYDDFSMQLICMINRHYKCIQ